MTDSPFAEQVGRRVREIRTATDEEWGDWGPVSQEDVARAARYFGLEWRRPTVTMIEAGERQLLAEEFLLLPAILSFAKGHDVTYRDLLPSGRVDLTAEAGLDVDDLLDLLAGEPPLGQATQSSGSPMERTDPDQWKQWTMIGEFTLRTGQVLEDQARSEELPDGVPGMAFSDARREAVRKAAASLGVAPLTAAVASWQTWGRGLTRERDDRLRQRLEGRDDAQTLRERQRRAMLGHVTRGLLDELRDRVVGVQQDLEERGLIEAEEEG